MTDDTTTGEGTITLVPGGHAFFAWNGKIDPFRLSEGYHNGPECARCKRSWCEHCEPDREGEPCPLADTALPGLDFA